MILDVYEAMMRRFLGDQEKVGQARLIDVRYENLQADPIAVLCEIYSALSLDEPPADAIGRFLRDTPAPSVKSRCADPLLEKRVRSQWGFAFDAWGYE